MDRLLNVIEEKGDGRPFIVLSEVDTCQTLRTSLTSSLSNTRKVIHISSAMITDNNWEGIADALIALLSERGIRQSSFIAFGPAASILFRLYLKNAKLVRAIVLIDATSRPHPSLISRAADWIEEHLPLGLPLRDDSSGFNVRPFLQRIRAPVLVITTGVASSYVKSEAEIFAVRLPTSWSFSLPDDNDRAAETLSRIVSEFQDVPARVPQKNMATI